MVHRPAARGPSGRWLQMQNSRSHPRAIVSELCIWTRVLAMCPIRVWEAWQHWCPILHVPGSFSWCQGLRHGCTGPGAGCALKATSVFTLSSRKNTFILQQNTDKFLWHDAHGHTSYNQACQSPSFKTPAWKVFSSDAQGCVSSRASQTPYGDPRIHSWETFGLAMRLKVSNDSFLIPTWKLLA